MGACTFPFAAVDPFPFDQKCTFDQVFDLEGVGRIIGLEATRPDRSQLVNPALDGWRAPPGWVDGWASDLMCACEYSERGSPHAAAMPRLVQAAMCRRVQVTPRLCAARSSTCTPSGTSLRNAIRQCCPALPRRHSCFFFTLAIWSHDETPQSCYRPFACGRCPGRGCGAWL